MFIKERPVALRLAVAVFITASALALAELIPYSADPSHFSLFFIAVMLSSWFGGLEAGLLATVLSAIALDYFFISPTYTIELDGNALLRLGAFSAIAALTSYLTTARKRAEEALRESHDQLDLRVRERTAELAQSNDALRKEITERKRAETELLRLQRELGRVERLATLGRMAGTIAHDLGTPLNSVLGYTQLLSQDALPERARRRLGIIETQIHRMGEIIQRYLNQSRSTPPRKEVPINDLIRDTLLLLQPVFDKRNVKVESDLAPALPLIYGDGNSIQRVLINLLDNALDACENNRGAIKISTREIQETGGKSKGIGVEIADTGAGIPDEMLPRIFDLFVTTKPLGRGTGLGLVICQEIIRTHGGTIQIASKVDRGTTVNIYLPADAPAPVETDA
jgi:two-component system C4-dicarboxylate transport sensor histidine kinase DctB